MAKRPPVSGDVLLADFQTVLTGVAMSQYAANEAERSEHQLLDQLADMGGNGYLSPGAITDQPDLSRGSLDVHVKKVQAQQLAQLSAQQIQQLVSQAKPTYVGRRLFVTALDAKNPPFDAVWFDAQTGYRTAQFRKRTVVGIIEDVRLDENMITLRPTLQRRLMTPGLQQYLVYVIDPATLTPVVKLDIVN